MTKNARALSKPKKMYRIPNNLHTLPRIGHSTINKQRNSQ